MHPVGYRKRWLALSLVLIVALAVALAACGGVAAPAEPSITLEPTSGAPGIEVAVTGEGFPVAVEINIRLGPPDVGASPEAYATTLTTESGGFSTSFILPETWPDGNAITEKELLVIALLPDGSVKATAPFDYQPLTSPAPELTLNPANGEAGARVTVTGANFPPNTTISLRLSTPTSEREPVEVAQVASDAQGGFRTVITIPLTWPNSDTAVREQALAIEAVRASGGPSLAKGTFFNVSGERSP